MGMQHQYGMNKIIIIIIIIIIIMIITTITIITSDNTKTANTHSQQKIGDMACHAHTA
jgi:flagellar basal body-associated protein FliL